MPCQLISATLPCPSYAHYRTRTCSWASTCHWPLLMGVGGEFPLGPVLDGLPRGLAWLDGFDLLEAMATLLGACSKVPRSAQGAHAELVADLARRAWLRARAGHRQEALQAWKALLLANILLHYRDPRDSAPKKRAGQGAMVP